MKKVILAAAAASILFTGAASAADLRRPVAKAPPPAPVAVYNWTGFYVGGHVGGAWADSDSNFVPLFNGVPDPVAWNRSPEAYGLNSSGILGGVHAGFNWQASPNFLIGIEGDWSWTDNNASQSINFRTAAGAPFAPPSPQVMSRNTDWLASIRGRLGVLVTPNVLLYGTGGAAFAHSNFAGTLSSVPPGTVWAVNFDDTRVGWVAGAGAEWAVTSNWLLRAEYLYYRLPGASANAVGVPNNFPGFTIQYNWSDFDIQVARVGLSYKFGGPVVAKY